MQSSSPEWSDYFEITYSSSDINSPYSLEFKDSKRTSRHIKIISKMMNEKNIDYDAFMAISAKDQIINLEILHSTIQLFRI